MSCKIWLAVFIVVCFTLNEAWNLKQEYNLCSILPGHFPNGDYFPNLNDSATVYIDLPDTTSDRVYLCFMKFTTCHNCQFQVDFISDFVFPACYLKPSFGSFDTHCEPGCTYLHIFDPDYKNETGHIYYQTPWGQVYRSESSKLYVFVCSNHSLVENIQLKLKISVIEKIEVHRGSSYDSPGNRYIHSPFFPHLYAENDDLYIYEWQGVNSNDFVQLIFDDWHLSPQTVFWFDHSNILGPVYGSNSRPVVYSKGNRLRMKFQTGVPTSSAVRQYMGFKATYKFYNADFYRQNIVTDCGKYELLKKGGIIQFDHSIPYNNDYYDCVWVVKRQPQYNHIYLKIISFKISRGFFPGQTDYWEIRDGLTSLGNLLVSPSVDDIQVGDKYVSSTGFYIRIHCHYSRTDDFKLAFTSFNYKKCNSGQYRCDNNRCIPYILQCDGYDHCGDNSDESDNRCRRNTYSNASSYTISIGVIIPMVVSIFLIVVICLLIIFIRRCRRLAQQNRQMTNERISSISGNSQRANRHHNRNRNRMNLTVQQDAPPAYDEVIRNTPIGYLNMAFAWLQPDDTVISPPSYEEATSSVTDLPRLNPPDVVHNPPVSSSVNSSGVENKSENQTVTLLVTSSMASPVTSLSTAAEDSTESGAASSPLTVRSLGEEADESDLNPILPDQTNTVVTESGALADVDDDDDDDEDSDMDSSVIDSVTTPVPGSPESTQRSTPELNRFPSSSSVSLVISEVDNVTGTNAADNYGCETHSQSGFTPNVCQGEIIPNREHDTDGTPNSSQVEVTPDSCQEEITPDAHQVQVTPARRVPRQESRNVLTREMLFSFPNNRDQDSFV